MFARLAVEADEDAFVELARVAVAETQTHLVFNEGKIRVMFGSYLATAHPTIFVVEDKREVIGFNKCTLNEYDFADGLFTTSEVLFVRPDRRGTRAAALLLRNFTRWSDKLGAIEATGGNDNAFHSDQIKKFFSRFGFEQVGFFMRRSRGANGQEGRI